MAFGGDHRGVECQTPRPGCVPQSAGGGGDGSPIKPRAIEPEPLSVNDPAVTVGERIVSGNGLSEFGVLDSDEPLSGVESGEKAAKKIRNDALRRRDDEAGGSRVAGAGAARVLVGKSWVKSNSAASIMADMEPLHVATRTSVP